MRSITVEREPIYRQGETVHGFAAGLFGIGVEDMARLSDDRLGRALDRLFDADRAALLTEVVLAVGEKFALRFDELHNDSTSVAFCGQYRAASGRRLRARTAPAITYGFSKDHRPDLKQLLFILTVAADGAVPVQFRVADGNRNDSTTQIESWNTLRTLAGRADFLYVADSKLCSHDNMEHIQRAGGRFVTAMPRSRQEDTEFRQWIPTHTSAWELVWDRPNPRRRAGPRDRWYVYQAELPSAELWPVIWVFYVGICVYAFYYFLLNFEEVATYRQGSYTREGFIVGLLMFLLVMELSRLAHPTLFWINIVLVVYTLWGYLSPIDFFWHPGTSFYRIVTSSSRSSFRPASTASTASSR
ncbi:MAG TPA: IS1634 family transposase [Casimicrobiaceae bacterium]